MRTIFLAVAFVGLMGTASAADPCEALSDAARSYLKANPNWTVLRLADLYADDRSLWSQYHKGICPGFAEVDFEGNGRKWTALALMRHGDKEDLERIILVRSGESGLQIHTIDPDFVAYCVIWKRPPETVQEWDTGKKTRIENESLIVERLESATQQYYWENGEFRYVQTSD